MARVIARHGRNFTEYHEDGRPANEFTAEISGADVNYYDGTAWQPLDENWLADGADGFVLKAGKVNHKIRVSGGGGRRWYPRRNVESEYITFGVPQYYNKSWRNLNITGYSVSGKTITLTTGNNLTIKIHNRWNGIKIDWILNTSAAPARLRYAVTLTGLTQVNGIVYGADGVRVASMMPVSAIDATGTELPCTSSFAGGYIEFSATTTGATYPVTIDPDYAGDTADKHIVGQNADYATARSTSSNTNNATATLELGQAAAGGNYICRAYLKFDTSSIPDTDTISQVNLKLVAGADTSVYDFDVVIKKFDWSSGDREAHYDGCLAADADDAIWRNTSGLSINTQYTSGNLSTSWVNKTGATYYGLISSRDISAIPPTVGSWDYITICSANNATEAYRPVLVVVHSAGGALLPISTTAQMQDLTGGMRG